MQSEPLGHARSRTQSAAVTTAVAMLLAGCFLFPDGADLKVETDLPSYLRGDGPTLIVINLRNAGGEGAILSGTDRIRIELEFFEDGEWRFDRCYGCFQQEPPVEATLELPPEQTHTETIEAGTSWRPGFYRILVPFRSAGTPRTTRWAYSRRFEVS